MQNHSGVASAVGNATELFALSDEQILEIEPDAQDVDLSRDSRPVIRQDTAAGDASGVHDTSRQASDASTEPGVSSAANASPTEHGTRLTSHDAPAAPPQWLAERMADPQSGAAARELWNGGQQARQEAAAYREIFAKPEEARSAAQRARLLDDIDRAYFAGDATQRAQLAASMLREDPAAFREMVFAGLRALEEAGTTKTVAQVYPEPRRAFRPEGLDSSQARPTGEANSPDRVSSTNATTPTDRRSLTPEGVSYNIAASEAHLARYVAFEKAANEDLERNVGGVIERTLDHALPNAGRADSAAMKGRLAATIRQDIEKALQGDRQLGEQVAQILAARRPGPGGTQTFRFDDEARAQVVRLIGERAQQLVPGAAKRMLNEWTQTTLASHRARANRTEAASARREVAPAAAQSRGEGSSPASSPHSAQGNKNRQDASATNASRRVDYRRLSDEQILDL